MTDDWSDLELNAECLRETGCPVEFDCALCSKHVDVAALVAESNDDNMDDVLWADNDEGALICGECYRARPSVEASCNPRGVRSTVEPHRAGRQRLRRSGPDTRR